MTRVARRAPLASILVAVSLLACSSGDGDDGGGTVNPPPPPPAELQLALEPVAAGFDFPLFVTSPPGDPRLFVAEKDGRIHVVEDGVTLPTPFLDLSALVSRGGEQGLLGLAFDPQYATTRRVFVSYTNLAGDNVLASYRRSSGSADVADPSSAVVHLTVDQPFSNHNGGHIAFGPDGYLYLGLGDGGGAADPLGNGQGLGELLGSILRIDVSGGTGYAVPGDNPFLGVTGARGEVWAYGLRNPWRFSFDRATGDLYIGDVGQSEREEIDVSTAADGAGRGRNYGWAVTEGDRCLGNDSCDRTGLTEPLVSYSHADGSCSVTGGYVYRGAAIPALQGTYFYSDFCSGWVRSFRLAGGGAVDQFQWDDLAPGATVTSFGEDAAGELYLVTGEGTIYRIVSP
ncbi:MAG TPA: PQQ-dependent sugar dehydrogenase [Gemmatimonadales bacterium]|nr:PQQ-dependent sugar dehydrogenase [Gemmatimonadales bacterium]